MRHIRLAVAVTMFALVGISCSSTSDADQPATAATTTAEQQTVNFGYIQTEYGEILNRGNCPDGEYALIGQGLKNSDFESMRIDVADLPPSSDRAKILKSLDSFTEGYDKLSDDGCGTAASFDAFCSVSNYTTNLRAETLRLQVSTAASQE